MLNPSKGNMYSFVTHTWNTIKGKCPHDCSYCYMRRFKQGDLRFDQEELKTDLGKGNFIFVGSSCDMWADAIPVEWIKNTLEYCAKFPTPRYLFQSKNPKRMFKLREYIPINSILGTTIETNRNYPQMGMAPPVDQRATFLGLLSKTFSTMVTIEPIMDFDEEELLNLIGLCNPAWVNIGADSQHSNLPEPPSVEKIERLVADLRIFTKAKLKKNLVRITPVGVS